MFIMDFPLIKFELICFRIIFRTSFCIDKASSSININSYFYNFHRVPSLRKLLTGPSYILNLYSASVKRCFR